MGLYKSVPSFSDRMGLLWSLGSIQNSAIIEYGCMGHMKYSRVFLHKAGVVNGAKLYSTHLDEADISLGSTERIDAAIKTVLLKDKPESIFLLPSSVPTLIGTDLSAICEELQEKYSDVHLIAFQSKGFDATGSQGVENSLLKLVSELAVEKEIPKSISYNVIGSCADLYKFEADVNEIRRIMKGAFNIESECILTSHCSVADIKKMGNAHINIVIRKEGEKAAKLLNKRFSTPYILDRPYGPKATTQFIKKIADHISREPDTSFINEEHHSFDCRRNIVDDIFNHFKYFHKDEITLSLGGHVDVVKGIKKFAISELGFPCATVWTQDPSVCDSDIPYMTEDEFRKFVANHRKGILMTKGDLLQRKKYNLDLQISDPDIRWCLNHSESPLVGYRGSLHLMNLWLNTLLENED